MMQTLGWIYDNQLPFWLLGIGCMVTGFVLIGVHFSRRR
jgi:hypothetical protein